MRVYTYVSWRAAGTSRTQPNAENTENANTKADHTQQTFFCACSCACVTACVSPPDRQGCAFLDHTRAAAPRRGQSVAHARRILADAVGGTHHARLVRRQACGLDEQAKVLVRLLELIKLHDGAVAELVPGAKGAISRGCERSVAEQRYGAPGTEGGSQAREQPKLWRDSVRGFPLR